MEGLFVSRQSLCEALRTKNVVLVLGADAVKVEMAGGEGAVSTFPLYQAVADELLSSYETTLPANQTGEAGSWLLHRAVAQILAHKSDLSLEKLRRSVSATINSIGLRVRAAPLLSRLATLRAFDLFICLTPDDCLVNALRQALDEDHVHISAYAPNADSAQPVDIAPRLPGSVRVFFPLGRSASGPRVAIHEEDALEYLYKFQEEGVRRMPTLLAELRTRDMLLLGCNLPDWLGRGFLRLANESRLSSHDRKMEFFAADTQDPTLNRFLARFAPNASVFPWSPEEFVSELEQIVGTTAADSPSPSPVAPGRRRSAPSAAPTVFVSYASEDFEPARRLAESLRGLGFADVWFDKRKLVAGDDWSDRIDEAIEHCDFFIPVLSSHADRRREGVFVEEWRKGLQRAMRVNDTFILPIGIDIVEPKRAGYDRIFSGFSATLQRLHMMHAPNGVLSSDGLMQLQERCRLFTERR